VNNFDITVGHMHLVLSNKVIGKLHEKRQQYPYVPDSQTMLEHLHALNSQSGVPATIGNYQGKQQLLLYTSFYYIALYESAYRDGYVIASLEPLDLRGHERLVKGALRIHAQSWRVFPELRMIPRGSSSYWDSITQAWRRLELQIQQASLQASQEELSYTHERFLDTVEDLVEMTYQLEQEKSNWNESIPYRRVETAGEERDAPRDIYIFLLTEFPRLTEKSMLRVKDMPDLQGRVLSLEGLKLTLKFEALIDRMRIPENGYLEPIASSLIYRKQCEALETLRAREAKNVHLLRVLADHVYQSYQPDRIRQESDEDLMRLTPEQFEAFRRALAVPDVLMVLGPPGTGKTRTITEIARYCGARHQRVLMTAGTHKAVDNVLERMPSDLIVIRVGHESMVSEKMRSKMIDAQAQKLQEVILENTENMAHRLGRLLSYKSEIDGWVNQVRESVALLADDEQTLQSLRQWCVAAEQAITTPFRPRLNELGAMMQHLEARITHTQTRIDTQREKLAKANQKTHLPVIGWLFKLLLNHYISSIERKQALIQQAHYELQEQRKEQASVYEAGQQALLAEQPYQQHLQEMRQLTERYEHKWTELLAFARTLQATVADLVSQQPSLEPKAAMTMQRFLSWYNQTRADQECKARLLMSWREELARPTDQLYPELLRYADVVGATCIGAATARGLQDIEFDLAIVDEAGQIGLPDLLVPLVRAKRAVLVGDHHQLPPFVDTEVQNWLRDSSAQADFAEEDDEIIDIRPVSDLLTKSAFEQLFMAGVDPAHIVRFTRQGRMPRVIADFASRHFYDGQLGTFPDEHMRHTLDHDPLFQKPLVVIDTRDAPSHMNNWEQEQGKLESVGEKGYINVAEAKLIASLAEVYQKAGKEWVVIVPYRAQARRIIRELKSRIDPDDFTLEERVATVDSFQGGERDKVIYGFTRNNRHGGIGFLKELRRLNVAMTRAQQHLILVGNFPFLTQATDPAFKNVMINLRSYADHYGEFLTLMSCRQRIQSALEGKKL
jgi:hypothetical protein